ncbi:Fe-hydrogenase, simple [Blattamonas nauphoetae]|uniref:Fe-hydrogenase, simple n=1 Tax=Blattamonas nauphoetae TaxID=2049346 RepID=A0ABQ9Y0T3_9EUKA|nr:Fe-hydrogenase, simple [Blattamonas nauphoetae]
MQLGVKNGRSEHLRSLMGGLIKAVLAGEAVEKIPQLPREFANEEKESEFNVTVEEEQELIAKQLIAMMGFIPKEEGQDEKTLAGYAEEALTRPLKSYVPEIVIFKAGCNRCNKKKYYISDACEGCVARPCMTNCPRKAITRTDHRCRIDESKCIGCSLCQKNCPYDAIVRRKIPCADECPMEALSKDAQGYSHINPEKCIHCGRCMTRCPFGCISMTSMIFDVARYLHQKDRPVIAMFAPAVFGQFPASPHQLRNACLKCGFSDMVEVSLGADTTSLTEAAEFLEHVGTGAQPVLMTSCCPAWVRAVRIHVPKLAPFLSDTGSPMKYTGDMLKARDPDCITVFVGPCTAKRAESQIIENTDLVLTAEEMQALFDACGVNPSAMPKDDRSTTRMPSREASKYCVRQGVTEAVLKAIPGAVKKIAADEEMVSVQKTIFEKARQTDIQVRPVFVSPLDRQSLPKIKQWGDNPDQIPGNMIECMCCDGGCVGGSGNIVPSKISLPRVMKLKDERPLFAEIEDVTALE